MSLSIVRHSKPNRHALAALVLKSAQSTLTSASKGWVAERFKAPVLKTGDVQASVGSNPTPSASLKPMAAFDPFLRLAHAHCPDNNIC